MFQRGRFLSREVGVAKHNRELVCCTLFARRNALKLKQVTKEYEKARESSCQGMNKAWDNRLIMMNNIVSRIVHFQVRVFSLIRSVGTLTTYNSRKRDPRWTVVVSWKFVGLF